MSSNIFVVAGGTGGHIMPALAIYSRLKKEKFSLHFICRKKDIRIVEQIEKIKNDMLFLSGKGIRRDLSFSNFLALLYVIYGILISLYWILKFEPKAVLSFGGYISFPLLFSSKLLGVPYFLFEQNSYPGVVNRIFSRWAAKIFINFVDTKKYFDKGIVVGNPIRDDLLQKVKRKDAFNYFGFNNMKKKVILISGGSQGSLRINEIAARIIEKMRDFNIIWITGSYSYEKFKEKSKKGSIYITSYLNDMVYAYSIADLAIVRAGAMTITELSYFGIPTIFIPLPSAAENHQFINAKIAEKSGGAFVFEEKNLNVNLILEKINMVLKKRSQYVKMKNGMKKLYKPLAVEKIVRIIKKEIV